MKRLILVPVTLALLFICLSFLAKGQPGPAITDSLIKKDSMNFAVLVLDFLTYKFEKANISYYPLCRDCDKDSLPFKVVYKPPGDFGDIKFIYGENDELLFGATIIWMGTGSIYQPSKFLKAVEFPEGPGTIEKPSHPQYFDFTLTPYIYTRKEYIARADSAWASVKSLEIVNEFASRSYRTGFYAWPPSVGVFCPSCAKWIIFLYSGNPFGQGVDPVKKETGMVVYPVPARDDLYIDFDLSVLDGCNISVFNSLGSLVFNQSGYSGRNIRLDVSGFETGLYYLTVRSQNEILQRKIMIIND
ncbi:MAG: T9SS type A sorting domain-containing protein [Bacteroidia bacterium]|nr:T9SS type A sorting domain-containing protein [Bacteroidia bacterium]